MTNTDVLIVGAGIAGLIAARTLVGAARSVQVIEKSRGVGGRLATRRIGDAVLDHGAQQFTVRHDAFASVVREAVDATAVTMFTDQPLRTTSGSTVGDTDERWQGRTGMTALAKFLAKDLRVHTNCSAQRVSLLNNHWIVTAGDGKAFEAGHLIITAPVPQAVALLASGSVPVQLGDQAILRSISYDPCIAVLAVLAAPSNIPAPGGLVGDGDPLLWLADHQVRGTSPVPAVTLLASADFSRAHTDASDDHMAALLLAAAAPWIGDTAPTALQIHRWRFSIARPPGDVAFDPPFLRLSGMPPLILAGDGFGGPRVEAAAMSGHAAARYLLENPG